MSTAYMQLTAYDSPEREQVQADLLDHSPLGFVDEETGWTCYFDVDAWENGTGEAVRTMIRERYPALQWTVTPLERINWNQEWEQSIQPIAVTDRIIIAPSWHPVTPPPGGFVLTIDPKMSFGTGFHETTRLMIRLLEGAIRGGERVLDVGTGTGVLAIAALMLGASSAVGVDIDEWSCENATENLRRNGITHSCDFYHGDITAATGEYDVVLANITRNDNISMLPAYLERLSEHGELLLSGFYGTDAADVIAAAGAVGFHEPARLDEAEWCAIRFTRRT